MDPCKGFVWGMVASALVSFGSAGGAMGQSPNSYAQPAAPAHAANAPPQPANAPRDESKPLAVDLAAPVLILKQADGVVVIEQVNGFMVRPAWNHEQIERLVFGRWGAASDGRRHLEWQLTVQLQDINRACSLTQAQRKKLELAGRGDIKRFFDRYEQLVRKSQVSQHNEPDLPELQQEAIDLQLRLNTGLFRERSLLVKSLPNTLTKEQLARYQGKALKGGAELLAR
jgi:hypothetical protein